MFIVRRAASAPRHWPHQVHRISWWLTTRRVPHAIIGGVATACFVPGRVPVDLDIVVPSTERAGIAAEWALGTLVRSLGLEWPRIPPFSAASVASGSELRLDTPRGALHLVGASLPDGVDRDELFASRRWWIVGGLFLPVVGVDALIELKRANASPKDFRDLRALEVDGGRRRRAK